MDIELSTPGAKEIAQPHESEIVLGPRLGLLVLVTGAGAGFTSGC